MKIQNKLMLVYSCIFGLILLLFTIGVYEPYSQQIHEDYFSRLHLRGLAKVDFIDGKNISPDILHDIFQDTPINLEPHVTIYTSSGDLVYRDKKVIKEIRHHSAVQNELLRRQHMQWWNGKTQTDAFYIEGHKTNYLVFVTGYDYYGYGHLDKLRLLLIIAYFVVMAIIVFFVRLFAAQAFKPVSAMIAEVKEISSLNLGIRLHEGNKRDELAQLAITFNRMLDQVEKGFADQRHLVYSISHELRTPLAAIIAELELSQSQSHTSNEYMQAIDNALSDAKRLARLSTDLLDMAKASYEPSEITMEKVRIDEALIEATSKVQAINSTYRINLEFDNEPEEESKLEIQGNNYLLCSAFMNIAENGCKYSFTHMCDIHLSFSSGFIKISFADKGLEILPEDRKKIFEPFYRGQNKENIYGNGIGLPLAKKIVSLHKGTIELINYGDETTFNVTLPNV